MTLSNTSRTEPKCWKRIAICMRVRLIDSCNNYYTLTSIAAGWYESETRCTHNNSAGFCARLCGRKQNWSCFVVKKIRKFLIYVDKLCARLHSPRFSLGSLGESCPALARKSPKSNWADAIINWQKITHRTINTCNKKDRTR